jgi:PAS domain S-box-containing protein
MKLLPRHLNNRTILLVAIVLCVTGILSGWFTATRQSERLITAMRDHSSVMVRHFAENCARLLILEDYAELESFLLKSVELPNVAQLQVCEPDGRIVGDTKRTLDGKLIVATNMKRVDLPNNSKPSVSISGEHLIFWYPITAGKLLGWIRADFSLASIKRTQEETLTQNLILAMLWVICSAAMIFMVLRPTAVALNKLALFARELNESKGNRIEVHHETIEIEALEESLNYASGKLLSAEQQLISDRERLRKSEENYRRLLDTIQEGIWVIDKDAVTTFVNPRMADTLGYTSEEMIGKPLFTFMDEQGRTIAEQNIERRKQGIKEQHDFEFIRKDGQRIYTRLETGPILDNAGNYIGSIAAVADITERKQSEIRLHASEQLFRSLAENSPDVIVRYDREGRRIYVNPEFERVNQLSAQEVIGKKPVELSSELAPIATEFTEKLMAAMASGKVAKIDLSWNKEGKAICWFVRVVPEFDADGKVVSALTIWNDITERKHTEEELRLLNEELDLRVQARTAELKGKNAELERLNKIFVGRELRMIELKERIKALEAQTSDNIDTT